MNNATCERCGHPIHPCLPCEEVELLINPPPKPDMIQVPRELVEQIANQLFYGGYDRLAKRVQDLL